MVLFFIMIVGCYKYYSYQKEKDLLDAKIIREKHQQFESQAQNEDGGKHFALTQNSKLEMSSVAKGYEDQYDPTNDFVIFGVSGKSKGGIVKDMKQNEADIMRKDSSGKPGKILTIPPSEGNSQVDIHSPMSAGSPGRLLTPQGQMLQAPLPEDQEIYESEAMSRKEGGEAEEACSQPAAVAPSEDPAEEVKENN
mmetsp:Transcript_20889/g.32286  ORF Transcript_20889/g.32286 Transcript_20889/m.32286 type:complete len:195 (-) Transcript_20889:36-620(-)